MTCSCATMFKFFYTPPDGASIDYQISNREFSDFLRTYYCVLLGSFFSLVIIGNVTHILPVLQWLKVVIAFVSSSTISQLYDYGWWSHRSQQTTELSDHTTSSADTAYLYTKHSTLCVLNKSFCYQRRILNFIMGADGRGAKGAEGVGLPLPRKKM